MPLVTNPSQSHAVARINLHHHILENPKYISIFVYIQVDEDGMREVNFELNGQKRAIMVKDNNATSTHTKRLKALDGVDSHVSRPPPFIFKIITMLCCTIPEIDSV